MKKILVVFGIVFAMFASLLVTASINETLCAFLLVVYFVGACIAVVFGAIKLVKMAKRKTTIKKQKPAPQAVQTPVIAETKQPTVERASGSAWEVHAISQTVNKESAPASVVTQKRTTSHATETRGNGIADRYSHVKIFVPYIEVLERPDIRVGAIVTFRQEPENRFDKRAVAVVIGRKRIGYLFRNEIQDDVNAYLDAGKSVSGRIVMFNPDAARPKGDSIAIDLYFYE